ncbi:MAG TPA: TRCF domain-containing protein, partial [Dehalococcoidia bacterium]|nr:TRCF domain-containing protein [Dehalococcoidia bacterium]
KVGFPDELDDLKDELEDRFGPLPTEVKDLLYMVRIKLLGSKADVESISMESGQTVLMLNPGARLDKSLLQRSFGSILKIGTNQMRLDAKRSIKEWQGTLEQLLRKMAQARDDSQSPSGS